MNANIARGMLLCVVVTFTAGSYADKPHDKDSARKNAAAVSQSGYFTDDRVRTIHAYYVGHKGKGCPPGLAKKANGCQPPGQAKQWHRGDILPADVVYHEIPVELSHELGDIPVGHKVVRVGTDLLLIAVGTRTVVDALNDLNDLF